MTWPEAVPVIVGIVGGLATVAGGSVKLAAAWTKKAEAVGRKALAEEQLASQVQELRDTFGRFMARMQEAEKRLDTLEIRDQERQRARRDTRGIPKVDDDDT